MLLRGCGVCFFSSCGYVCATQLLWNMRHGTLATVFSRLAVEPRRRNHTVMLLVDYVAAGDSHSDVAGWLCGGWGESSSDMAGGFCDGWS